MLPPDAAPAVTVVVGQEVLVGEHVVGEEGRGLEGGDEGRPPLGRGVKQEHAPIEQGVGALEGRVIGARDRRRRRQGRRVGDGRVGAVGGRPVVRRPRVVVEVAHAGVGGGQPVGARERGVEDGVHVAEEVDVGVEENEGVVGRQPEDAQLRPRVFEAGGDQRWGVGRGRQERGGGHNADERVKRALKL